PFAYQPANPCGAQHLVAAEGVEVDSEVVELDSHVRRALRAIYYCRYAARDLPHIAQCRDRTRGVRYMRDREHLGASRDQRAQMIEVEATVRRDLGDLKGGLSAQRELLPRNKVGVMLQSRDDDFIAAMYIGRRGDQIQGFRRAASEDQAIGIRDAEKASDAQTGGMVSVGSRDRQCVCPTVGIRIGGLIHIA